MIAIFNPEMEEAMKANQKTWSAIFNCVVGGVLAGFFSRIVNLA